MSASLRFTITGGTGGGSGYCVNGDYRLPCRLWTVLRCISGSGTVSTLEGGTYTAIYLLRHGDRHRRAAPAAALRRRERHSPSPAPETATMWA